MQSAERWILAHFTEYLPSRRTVAELPEPPIQQSFNRCWTGSCWSPQVVDGKAFDSEEQATHYLDRNRELLLSRFNMSPREETNVSIR